MHTSALKTTDVCACVCVCVRVRACVCVRVCACVRVRVFVSWLIMERKSIHGRSEAAEADGPLQQAGPRGRGARALP